MKRILLMLVFSTIAIVALYAQQVIKIGIIGLDTSHAPAFIELLNSNNPKPEHQGFKVVAAYPYGSRTIKSSYERIPGYVEKAKENGVEIVQSIAELLKKSDCVMLETNDGNLHLEQAAEVLKSGKPMFIDKPVAGTLRDAIAIFTLAKRYKVPLFSSSALRFVPRNQALSKGEFGKVFGADCFSPATSEPSHADFSWYGIHGVETLFTVMGTGCKQVTRVSAQGTDVVTGLWEDGRIGTFRGIQVGKHDFGGTAFTEKGSIAAGGYEGYTALLTHILQFFKTKIAPVPEQETIEIFTFMEASNESKRNGGCSVLMSETIEKAKKEAEKILSAYK